MGYLRLTGLSESVLEEKDDDFCEVQKQSLQGVGCPLSNPHQWSRFHLVDESRIIFPRRRNNFVIFNAPKNMNSQFNTKFSMTIYAAIIS